MELGNVDMGGAKFNQINKVSSAKDASTTFQSQLVSKFNFHSGAVQAAHETHKQTLLKAKSVKENVRFIDDEDEEGLLDIIKELKSLIQLLKKSEKNLNYL